MAADHDRVHPVNYGYPCPLTPRQLQFLALTANGKNKPEIAELCFVSSVTVRDMLDDARERLDANTAAHAVAIAISLELIVFDANSATFVVASSLISV